MNEHLDDVQLTELLAGAGSPETQAHVAACAACAAERERLAAALGDWRHDVRASAERPAAFWEAQQRAIADRRAAAAETSGSRVAGRDAAAARADEMRTLGARLSNGAWDLRWAAAAVAAVLLLAIGLLLRPERAAAPVLVAATPTLPAVVSPNPASTAADDALLIAVEGALARRAPAALAPAEALLDEIGRRPPRRVS